MNSWKIILAAVVIFGAGVMTGGLLVNNVEQLHPNDIQRPPGELTPHPQANNRAHDRPRPQDLPKPRPPEMLGKQFVQQLDNALHVTPEQRAAIAKIVADGQERNREIWTNVAPQMHKVLQDVRQQIREQLTAEQQKQFEELMKRAPRRPPNSTNSPPSMLTPEEQQKMMGDQRKKMEDLLKQQRQNPVLPPHPLLPPSAPTNPPPGV